MRRVLSFAMTLAMTMTMEAAGASAFFPPETPARPVVDVLHGTTLTDRYRWLENGKDAEVAAWPRAQHAATVQFLDSGHGTGKTQQQRVIDRDYELRFLMKAL